MLRSACGLDLPPRMLQPKARLLNHLILVSNYCLCYIESKQTRKIKNLGIKEVVKRKVMKHGISADILLSVWTVD